MLQSFPLVRLAALDLDCTLLNRNNEVTLCLLYTSDAADEL